MNHKFLQIRSTVVENLDEYYPRECAFLVYCDARFTPPVITRELAKSTVYISEIYKLISELIF
ncbi:unnamed protein product [Brugia pahangi]|uniref:HELICc2 domain-containing protein n=1 Tax=Brugia pahangi TaxID=6280 RepID=A0A0N4TE26_BRUPA|nr:unnamed protein product [Brugia pahangi]